MPEGDSIERIARRLAPLVGVPLSVEAPHPRHALDRIGERLSGAALAGIEARGKHLLLRFSNGLVVHSHLRMRGRWAVVPAGAPWPRHAARAWLVLRGAGLEAVLFDGPVLEVLTPAEASLHPALARLGPDVLDDGFDPGRAAARLRRREPTEEIGAALLDQRALAGVGNVWKSETLWACRVDPFARVGDLDDAVLRDLAATASAQMAAHVAGGAPRRPVAVYGRAGRPCPRCGTPIAARLQGDEGRRTFWCPTCQAGRTGGGAGSVP